jgi:hypothetical protein
VSFASAKSKSKTPQVCRVPFQSQQSQPGIALQVLDPQGLLLPNARVILMDKDDKVKFSGATSGEGELNLTGIAPGTYSLSVSAPGFRTYTSQVSIKDNKILSVKLQMKIAETKVEIEVTTGVIEVQGGITTVTLSGQGMPAEPGHGHPTPLRP